MVVVVVVNKTRAHGTGWKLGVSRSNQGSAFFNLLCDFRTIAFPRWVFLFLAEVPPGLSQVFHVEQGAFPFGLGGGGVICLLQSSSSVPSSSFLWPAGGSLLFPGPQCPGQMQWQGVFQAPIISEALKTWEV